MFGAHSTASITSWAGLPYVHAGVSDHMMSTIPRSFLKQLDVQDELWAENVDDFVTKAVRLFEDPRLYGKVREKMDLKRGNMFDGFVGYWESLLFAMYEARRAFKNGPARHVVV